MKQAAASGSAAASRSRSLPSRQTPTGFPVILGEEGSQQREHQDHRTGVPRARARWRPCLLAISRKAVTRLEMAIDQISDQNNGRS